MLSRNAIALALVATLAGAPSARAVEGPPALSFAQSVALAARQNTDVSLANLRVREASARTGQSWAAFLPGVTAQAVATDRTFNVLALGFTALLPPGTVFPDPVIGPVYEAESRLKVSQTLFDVSSWQKVRASKLGERSATTDRSATAEAAAYRAALAYLRAARAAAVVEAREEDVRLAIDLQGLAEAQLAAGTSPDLDVTRARAQVVTARGALVVARNQLDRARLDLTRVLGLDPAIPVALADTLDASLGASEAPSDSGAAVSFALSHRSDLLAEGARLDRARADRAATAAERLPRVDVAADWGGSGEHFGDSRSTYTYALAVTVPLLDGLRRESRIREQSDLVHESEVRSHDLRDQVSADVEAARLDLASGLEQESVAADQLRLAVDEVSQARERFVSGIAGNIDVIEAQTSLLKAHDADIDARFAVATARAALAHAAGVATTLH